MTDTQRELGARLYALGHDPSAFNLDAILAKAKGNIDLAVDIATATAPQPAPTEPTRRKPKPRTVGEPAADYVATQRSELREAYMQQRWLELISGGEDDGAHHPSVGLIVGRRRMGKTGLGYWLLELLSRTYALNPYAIGLPSKKWHLIEQHVRPIPPEEVTELPENSVVFVDEAAMFLFARHWQTNDFADILQKLISISGQRKQTLIFGAHNCLEVGQRILTDDMRWKHVEDLQPGDRLASFDEHGPHRKFRVGTVLANSIHEADGFEVTLEDGTEVVTTGDHPWLAGHSVGSRSTGPHYKKVWVSTRKLRFAGSGRSKVMRFSEPSTIPLGFDEGWLSGLFDGEGSLMLKSKKCLGPRLNLTQQEGPVLDRARKILSKHGFDWGEQQRNSAFPPHRPYVQLYLKGGHPELARFFEMFRPVRLLNKWDWERVGTTYGMEPVPVTSVRAIGPVKIARLGVDTRTYIAEGFLHHNTRKLDVGVLADIDWMAYKTPSQFHCKLEREKFGELSREALHKFLTIPTVAERKRTAFFWGGNVEGERLTNGLPSFWSQELSEAYAGLTIEGKPAEKAKEKPAGPRMKRLGSF